MSGPAVVLTSRDDQLDLHSSSSLRAGLLS
jgi:hypothetical protein